MLGSSVERLLQTHMKAQTKEKTQQCISGMITGENILIHYLCQDETHLNLTTSFFKYCEDWLKTETFQFKRLH